MRTAYAILWEWYKVNLPIRYLGLPLLEKKLKHSHFSALIESIRERVDCWKSKFLSFAGRLELIRSVLYSIQYF